MFEKYGKFNRKRYGKSVRKFLYAVSIIAWAEVFSLSVWAASATLESESAVIYEKPDEESTPTGNLVRGSAFEYLGDITAEDGSVWRQITIAGGIAGYIRGNIAIEGAQEASEVREVQEAFAEGDALPDEADMREEESEAAGEAEEDGGQEDENFGKAGEKEKENGEEIIAAGKIENNRTKNYATGLSGKIKVKDGIAKDAERKIPEEEKVTAGLKIDITLFSGMGIVIACTIIIYILWIKIKRLR